MSETIDAAQRARRRALRAARAVTLGLALATGGAGCFGSHARRDRAPEPEPDPMRTADAGSVEPDPDGGRDEDAGLADAGSDAGGDAGGLCDASGDWMAYDECCREHGWDPEWGCFAWGPFVPPAEVV